MPGAPAGAGGSPAGSSRTTPKLISAISSDLLMVSLLMVPCSSCPAAGDARDVQLIDAPAELQDRGVGDEKAERGKREITEPVPRGKPQPAIADPHRQHDDHERQRQGTQV